MNTAIRRIARSLAISSAAGIALLSGAATASAMDAASGRADDSHRAAVVQLAADGDKNGTGTGSIENGLNGNQPQQPNGQYQQPGSGYQQPNPYQQTPAYSPNGLQTQASGGAIATGVVAILTLGIIVFVRVKHRSIKPGDAVLVGLFGIALSGTVVGAMGSQMTNSVLGSLGNVLGGL